MNLISNINTAHMSVSCDQSKDVTSVNDILYNYKRHAYTTLCPKNTPGLTCCNLAKT